MHPPTYSVTHSFIHSFILSVTHSAIYSFIYSFTHSFILSPTHSFIHSLIYYFTNSSLTQSLIHSLTLSYLLIHLLSCYSFTHSFIHYLTNSSFTQSFTHSFPQPLTLYIHSFTMFVPLVFALSTSYSHFSVYWRRPWARPWCTGGLRPSPCSRPFSHGF